MIRIHVVALYVVCAMFFILGIGIGGLIATVTH